MSKETIAKFSVIIYVIIAVLFCLGTAAILYFDKGYAETPVEESIEFAEVTPAEYYPTSLTDWDMPTAYWYEDGYSDLQTWWEDLKQFKADNEDIAEPAIDKWGSYLSDEDESRLQEIESLINSSSSVVECLELRAEFDQIVAAATPAPVTYSSTGGSSYTGSTSNFKSMGVIYSDGYRYTWYSQNVLPGGGLSIPGRHVGEGNLIYDESGYVVVAANRSDYAYGAVVSTPFGEGKVYDTGCAQGTIDIYTNF